MINGKCVIVIIPARGGSKGLPGKNIRPLCGKPLVAWSIEKALKSAYVDTVMVSTDSSEIADISKSFGAEVIELRPAMLATDQAPTFDVVEHVLKRYRELDGLTFDYVVLMEPTSPLREDGDIDSMLESLDKDAEHSDSIVSVGEVSEHPSILKRLVQGRAVPYCPELPQTTRRQDNEPAYFPYCVAYIAKTDALLSERSFYTKRCLTYRIKRYQNYEIDDIYDMLCVETIMKHQWRLA
jgi:CMP-N,N'-diacetyllegionaminic acid synthase